MNIEEKERLARRNDIGLGASAIRLRAARHLAGLNQTEMAAAIGIKKTALNNAENGLTAPSRQVMGYFYRAHRIDFNFMINGDFSQLPGDVQDAIFAALLIATSEWDRRERSNRDRAGSTVSQD